MDNIEQIIDLARTLGIEAEQPKGDLVCAFVGEWNAGKSSLANALTGIGLPARPTPTTRAVVRLARTVLDEPKATVIDQTGQARSFTGSAALEVLDRSIEDLAEIDVQIVDIDIPSGVVFVDTPGFNDQDQVASSRAETVLADIVVFVLQATGSTVNQTQLDFIRQVLLTKGNLEDLLFVVTHADLLDSSTQRSEIDARYRELFGSEASARLFLVSVNDPKDVAAFKEPFYRLLSERQPSLLMARRKRLRKQLLLQMRQEVDRRRALLVLQRDENAERARQLDEQINEARAQEREQRRALRKRYRARQRDAIAEIGEAADGTLEIIEGRIEGLDLQSLQTKGEVQRLIEEALHAEFKPRVEQCLQQLLQSLESEVDGAQRFSSDLLRNLSIQLPAYDSPLAAVSADHLLPIAAIGSIAVFGWLSVPTLVMGFLAIKARDMGLTRFDKTGLFDRGVETLKDMTAGAYRQSLKQIVARALSGYRDQVNIYVERTVTEVAERALAQINGIEALERSYWQLRDGTSLLEQELQLDNISHFLEAESVARSVTGGQP